MLSTLPSFLFNVTSAGEDVADRERDGEHIFSFGEVRAEKMDSSAGLGGRTRGTVVVVIGTL